MYYILVSSLRVFFQLVSFLLIVRVLLSWVRVDPYNKYIILLYNLTEPILVPFRKLSGKLGIQFQMIDISPLLAMLVIQYFIQPLAFMLLRLIF
jgi:YggT family protein